MPRPPRITRADGCYHVINRGNGRANVFHKDADFAAFARILSLACERHSMRLLAWCLMHNHFHLVLWPERDGAVTRFMQWVTTCHVRRYHRHYKGSGHVWQGRYKCFPIEPGPHLMTVLRYVERNRVRAGLVRRAQEWAWSSAKAAAEMGSGSGASAEMPDPISAGAGAGREPVRRSKGGQAQFRTSEIEPDPAEPDPEDAAARPLADWLVAGPFPRPQPWLRFVNREEEAEELARLREAVNRGSPFGDDAWRENAARKLGLEATIRPRGRPVK
jgi:putative transposase